MAVRGEIGITVRAWMFSASLAGSNSKRKSDFHNPIEHLNIEYDKGNAS